MIPFAHHAPLINGIFVIALVNSTFKSQVASSKVCSCQWRGQAYWYACACGREAKMNPFELNWGHIVPEYAISSSRIAVHVIAHRLDSGESVARNIRFLR